MEADHNFNHRSARIVSCSIVVSTGASSRLDVTLTLHAIAGGATLNVYMTKEEALRIVRTLSFAVENLP